MNFIVDCARATIRQTLSLLILVLLKLKIKWLHLDSNPRKVLDHPDVDAPLSDRVLQILYNIQIVLEKTREDQIR